MKGFMLTDGDLSITNGEIDIVEGTALTAQTIQQVISTNKGEWLFNKNEGIDFNNLLGKHRIKTTSAKETYFQKEFISLRSDEHELAEKLRKRLDGE